MQVNRRQQRVAELIKRSLSQILRRNFSIETVGVVSITDVALSSDLRSATVYLSYFGKMAKRHDLITQIKDKTKLIQMQMAQDVILKYTPEIHFQLDDSLERGNRVLEILDELEKQNAKKLSAENSSDLDISGQDN